MNENFENGLLNVKETLNSEKERLSKIVKAAVEAFYDNTKLLPDIQVYKKVTEIETKCSTIRAEGDLEIKITVKL